MFKKIVLSFIIYTLLYSSASAQANRQVEIFDLTKEQVVKQTPSSTDIQQEAKLLLNSMTTVYNKLNPIPTKGFMVKIPFEPPFKVKHPLFENKVDEVILIFPAAEDPFLLVFTSEQKTRFFHFSADTEPLLKKIKFKRAFN